MDYELLDSGEKRKLERYGEFLLVRPDPQVVWQKNLSLEIWDKADAVFGTGWKKKSTMPDTWVVEMGGYKFEVSLKNFKHTGVFPEQIENWAFIENSLKIKNSQNNKLVKILNLFGYTGGATLAAAKVGAEVTHVDASKPAITAAKENTKLNGLEEAPIRWILDDCQKFVAREARRGIKYDGIIMDPPVFGRGTKGEVWKIEEDLLLLLRSVKNILSPNFKFIILNGYASGYTSVAYAQTLSSVFGLPIKEIEHGELTIKESSLRGFSLPAGMFARYSK